MHVFTLFALVLVALSDAKPNITSQKNVITVPPNCPDGQVWLNGQCREVWNIFQTVTLKPIMFPEWMTQEEIENIPLDSFDPQSHVVNTGHEKNVVTVPPNCPTGQEWINGACRDIWMFLAEGHSRNAVTVPPNCPTGEVFINGQCRTVWLKNLQPESNKQATTSMNALGETANENELTKNFQNKNIISVPNQCPTGYKPDANGICREIFV